MQQGPKFKFSCLALAVLLSACSLAASQDATPTSTLPVTRTPRPPIATIAPPPTHAIPAQFAGPTATQPADPIIKAAPGFWIWNPHQAAAFLQYKPEDWHLIVGGDPQPYVFEGFQGLFHKELDSCILSLSGGGNAPFTWQKRPEIISLADLDTQKDVYRDEGDVRVMILYTFPTSGFSWTFLLGSASITVSEPCMKAAEQVLGTLVIIP
ncbi:MAG: hypothetical protein WD740_06705 [Anaerolineales bacterium]